MPRIRSIKPEFFLHEGLAELSAYHRLAFIGLWTLADRDGRLEDRPKRIKVSLFPYEDVDLDMFLDGLHLSGFINRYEVNGLRYIAIPGFSKHQKPHPKESSFNIPPPTGREISRQAVEENCKPEKGVVEQGGCLSMVNGSGNGNTSPSAPGVADQMQDVWNSKAPPKCPRWKRMTEGRRKTATARALDHSKDPGGELAWWNSVVDIVASSGLLRGDKTSWVATVDWVLKPANLVKIEEGNYQDVAQSNPSLEIGDFSSMPEGRVEL